MPMTVETEPLDVAVATEAATVADLMDGQFADEPKLKIHDGDDVVDAPDPMAVHLEDAIAAAADEPAAEAASVDYDDAVVAQAAEPSPAVTTSDSTAVSVQVAAATPRRAAADDAATLAKIAEVAEEVRYWREQQALLKEQAKEAKENLQGAVNRLMRLSTEVANDATRPLLGVAEATGKPVESAAESVRTYQGDPVDPLADAPATAAPAAEPLPSPSTEAWRAYRFDDPDHFPSLAAQKAIVAKLAEAGIETVGGMVEFTKPGEGGYCKSLTDIKGIGRGKVEKIEVAMEEFWANHPDILQSGIDAS